MSFSAEGRGPQHFVGSVVHPTDFSQASHTAFAHALAIALIRRTRLDILNVASDASSRWSRFPPVRATLERWGLLEPGSDRAAVYEKLSVRVRKVQLKGDPIAQTLDYVRKNDPELLVFSTARRRGIDRWREPSVAQAVARRSRTMTLFVREGGRTFVRPEDGRLSLNRILVPIGRTPDATQAIEFAVKAAEAMGDPPVEITLLHVGEGPLPHYDRREGDDWLWREVSSPGDVADVIVAKADEIVANLIVMASDGRNGVIDLFRGSFTERVTQRANCPVLSVPAPTVPSPA